MKREPFDYIPTIIMCIVVLLMVIIVKAANSAEPIDLNALAMVESSNNNKAVSFLGEKYGRGKWQVSEALLRDYNRVKHENVQPNELFNEFVCLRVAKWAIEDYIPMLLEHYGCEVTDDAILQAYNLGTRAYAKGKRNKNYLDKYYNYLGK